jgi:6-pyruvoyltetrahydropterin/6-carboxytetrahydropterin synthase
MYELSKHFWFEAAHTLERVIDTCSSRRIHGHSYRAQVTLRGVPDPKTGMILDLGLFEQVLAEMRDRLDHHFLDEVEGLGPATLENLAAFLWRHIAPRCPTLCRITIFRDSTGDQCAFFGPSDQKNHSESYAG